MLRACALPSPHPGLELRRRFSLGVLPQPALTILRPNFQRRELLLLTVVLRTALQGNELGLIRNDRARDTRMQETKQAATLYPYAGRHLRVPSTEGTLPKLTGSRAAESVG